MSQQIPIHVILDDFFVKNPRIRSVLTRNQYRFALGDFRRYLGREPMDVDLCNETLGGLANWLVRVRKLAPKTANERVGRFCTLWSWLTKMGRKERFPLVARIPEPRRIPVAWTEQQLNQLMASLNRVRGWVGDIPAADWWRALHWVMWSSGERISAVMACRWDNLDGDWLTVPAELRKGQLKDMAYRLSQQTLASLETIREPTRDLIFPWPYDEKYLWTRYKTIRRQAGLPTDRRSSFHRIRRSVATHAAAAGQNPSLILGHADPRITQAYLDPKILKPPQPSDVLFKIG